MKNWINKFIAFLRFVFRGKLSVHKPTIVSDTEYKTGGLFTDQDGSDKVVVKDDSGAVIPIMETQPGLARRIIDYMYKKGYNVDMSPENGNIVYISGLRDAFGFPHENKVDEWDDLRLIIKFNESGPYIDFWQAASCEPGTISRKSAAAKKLGGVATVVPGQYKAWKMGYHKHDHDHPALVQCANIVIWRDANENASFDNEMMFEGIYGINQHSTKPGFSGPRVGAWSAGCLVGKDFAQHLQFIDKVKQWKAYRDNPDFVFTATIIPGKALFNDSQDNA